MPEDRPSPHGIEVELVVESRTAPFHDAPWRMLEVWTQNSIYAIDAAMRCFDVIDRSSLRPVLDHALIGARLVGGQKNHEKGVELAHPFPLPGMEAVFEQILKEKSASFSYSSPVTRVVLRQRRILVEGSTSSVWGAIVEPGAGETSPPQPPLPA